MTEQEAKEIYHPSKDAVVANLFISRATFYDWIKKDKKFANQIEEIEVKVEVILNDKK